MTYQRVEFQHVTYLWDDTVADTLDPVECLRYRSNLLGSDQRITNTGGGNTSCKATMPDPLTKETLEVLWVKGSGGDLRTATRANFTSLRLDKLLALQGIYNQPETRGAKTEIEDAMVGGHLASLAEGCALIRRSFPVQTCQPHSSEAWEAAYHRYLHLKG